MPTYSEKFTRFAFADGGTPSEFNRSSQASLFFDCRSISSFWRMGNEFLRCVSWRQSCKSGREWAGFGKMFRACAHNFFITFRVTIFLSWSTLVVLVAVTSVSKVIAIFLQLILHVPANTATFFCSLLRLFSHSLWECDSREEISAQWRCFEKINRFSYAIHCLL